MNEEHHEFYVGLDAPYKALWPPCKIIMSSPQLSVSCTQVYCEVSTDALYVHRGARELHTVAQ